jgi:hypothetical protein
MYVVNCVSVSFSFFLPPPLFSIFELCHLRSFFLSFFPSEAEENLAKSRQSRRGKSADQAQINRLQSKAGKRQEVNQSKAISLFLPAFLVSESSASAKLHPPQKSGSRHPLHLTLWSRVRSSPISTSRWNR